MTSSTAAAARDPATRAARIITEVLTPVVPVLLICVLCGVHGAPRPGAGLGWGLLAGLFCAVIPFAVIEAGVRRRGFSDRQVSRREERRGAYVIGIGSVLCGAAALVLLGAPALLTWALATMVVGLLVCAAVTAAGMKASLHMFCASALGVFAALLVSPWWLLMLPVLLPTIAWSRLHLRQHTRTEVVLGAVLGAAVTVLGWLFVPVGG